MPIYPVFCVFSWEYFLVTDNFGSWSIYIKVLGGLLGGLGSTNSCIVVLMWIPYTALATCWQIWGEFFSNGRNSPSQARALTIVIWKKHISDTDVDYRVSNYPMALFFQSVCIDVQRNQCSCWLWFRSAMENLADKASMQWTINQSQTIKLPLFGGFPIWGK